MTGRREDSHRVDQDQPAEPRPTVRFDTAAERAATEEFE